MQHHPAPITGRFARLAARFAAFGARLLRDREGNTIVMVAAAILPLVALVGSGVDMGRSYLVQSRLQRACDAGVLSARKELSTFSSYDPNNDQVKVDDTGARFFNVNFPAGVYGTQQRSFQMEVQPDYSINGIANTVVPTTIMKIFNFNQIPVAVHCTAQLTNADTDIMMALDVTGSMNETLSGDTQSKISSLKATVKSFFASMMANKVPGARIRFGFVPYSTNANVGALLKDEWVTKGWTYDSRVLVGAANSSGTYSYWTAISPVSGVSSSNVDQTYDATWDGTSNSYKCTHLMPSSNLTTSIPPPTTTTEQVTGPPSGTKTTNTYLRTRNGYDYSVQLVGKSCTVMKNTYTNYVDTYQYITVPALQNSSSWLYKPVATDTTNWRTQSNGCMEERSTYDIDDYDNVDLSQALDLDIDGVPVAGDIATMWKPAYPSIIYDRSIQNNGKGKWSVAQDQTNNEYVAPGSIGLAACPAPAKKLQEWTQSDLDTYISTLNAAGSTYHDIGMLWAARLLSPGGIMASDNADGGKTVNRHLIFLTDGQTSTLDLSYSAYGVEPIDQRRWNPSDTLTLNQVVEKRFTYICNEVKNHNITVWFIAYGTDLNPIMTNCAGPGHYFSAKNSQELNDAFAQIGKNIGDLRLQN